MAFPTTSTLDNFNRGDESPATGWPDVIDGVYSQTIKVVSNQGACIDATDAFPYWGTSYAADQEGWITAIGTGFCSIYARLNPIATTSVDGYEVEIDIAAAAPTVAAVSSSLVSENGNQSTMTVTLPAHQTDDILLVQALQGTSSTLTCATSGWTKIDGTADDTMSTGWFWKRAASASETAPVIDTTSNFTNPASGYGAVMVIRGAVASGTPYESATKSTIDTSATLTTAALTTTGTYRLGITFTAVEDDNDVTTTPTGWADEMEITSTTGSDALAYGASQSISAATTVGAETFSMNASDRHESLSLAFIPEAIVKIKRFDNDSATQLGASISQTFSSGDAIGIECIGNDISAYYKASGGSWGSAVGTRTDSTYNQAGYPGLYLFDASMVVDDFGGGAVVSGGTNPRRRALLGVGV